MGVVNQETIEKGIKSMVISLQQAIMVTQRMNQKEANVETAKFIVDRIIKDTLGLSIKDHTSEVQGKLHAVVKTYVNEYKDKKDKAYTGLLRLEEQLS